MSRGVMPLTRKIDGFVLKSSYDRLQAENARLRELVMDMGELLDVLTECDLACKHYHDGCIGDCYYVNARRELGVEVDG